jgi:hypothetical protein
MLKGGIKYMGEVLQSESGGKNKLKRAVQRHKDR